VCLTLWEGSGDGVLVIAGGGARSRPGEGAVERTGVGGGCRGPGVDAALPPGPSPPALEEVRSGAWGSSSVSGVEPRLRRSGRETLPLSSERGDDARVSGEEGREMSSGEAHGSLDRDHDSGIRDDESASNADSEESRGTSLGGVSGEGSEQVVLGSGADSEEEVQGLGDRDSSLSLYVGVVLVGSGSGPGLRDEAEHLTSVPRVTGLLCPGEGGLSPGTDAGGLALLR